MTSSLYRLTDQGEYNVVEEKPLAGAEAYVDFNY